MSGSMVLVSGPEHGRLVPRQNWWRVLDGLTDRVPAPTTLHALVNLATVPNIWAVAIPADRLQDPDANAEAMTALLALTEADRAQCLIEVVPPEYREGWPL